MTFKEAIEQTPQVAEAYKDGLQAFRDYSSKVVVPDNKLLVHTASTSETSTVLRKLEWLKAWLREQAPEIDKLKSKSLPPFYWVQSKQYALPTHTPQYRKAVSAKLIPIKEWNYELLCKQYTPQPKSKKRVPKYLRESKNDN